MSEDREHRDLEIEVDTPTSRRNILKGVAVGTASLAIGSNSVKAEDESIDDIEYISMRKANSTFSSAVVRFYDGTGTELNVGINGLEWNTQEDWMYGMNTHESSGRIAGGWRYSAQLWVANVEDGEIYGHSVQSGDGLYHHIKFDGSGRYIAAGYDDFDDSITRLILHDIDDDSVKWNFNLGNEGANRVTNVHIDANENVYAATDIGIYKIPGFDADPSIGEYEFYESAYEGYKSHINANYVTEILIDRNEDDDDEFYFSQRPLTDLSDVNIIYFGLESDPNAPSKGINIFRRVMVANVSGDFIVSRVNDGSGIVRYDVDFDQSTFSVIWGYDQGSSPTNLKIDETDSQIYVGQNVEGDEPAPVVDSETGDSIRFLDHKSQIFTNFGDPVPGNPDEITGPQPDGDLNESGDFDDEEWVDFGEKNIIDQIITVFFSTQGIALWMSTIAVGGLLSRMHESSNAIGVILTTSILMLATLLGWISMSIFLVCLPLIYLIYKFAKSTDQGVQMR